MRPSVALLLASSVLIMAMPVEAQFRWRPQQTPALSPIIGPPTAAQQIAARQLSMLRFASQRYPNLLSPVVVQNRVTPVLPSLPIVNQLNPAVANPLINPALTNPLLNPALANPLLNPNMAMQNPWMPNSPYTNPYVPCTNPYVPVSNPALTTGLTPVGTSYPYNTGTTYPYSGSGTTLPYESSASLFGQADVLRSTANVAGVQEQARLGRESAHQAWLEVEKKKFDLEKYQRDNTPTATDERLAIAKERLQRIQQNATTQEINSGKALTILLDALNRTRARDLILDDLPLSEDVLRRINVAAPGGDGNFGLFRDGQIAWPQALQSIVPKEEQLRVENLVRSLFVRGTGERLDADSVNLLRAVASAANDVLAEKANEIPTGQYLDAKRFLSRFQEGIRALEKNEAAAVIAFQQFIRGGKSTSQVVDYMLERGLRVAPACEGDAAAYRAVFDALSAHARGITEPASEGLTTQR